MSRDNVGRAERQADYRAGVYATLFYNANRPRNTAPRKLWHFFPSLTPDAQTDEEMYEAFQSFSKHHNEAFVEA